MLDFTKPHTFLDTTFKPSKHGAVRKSQVVKMLKSGHAECYTYEYDDMTGVTRSIMDPENLLGVLDECKAMMKMGAHGEYGNPRYAHQTYVTVHFHGNRFLHVYDVRELPELAEPTEEESEGCQECEECPVEDILVPDGYKMRLEVSNGPLDASFHWRKQA